MSSQLQTLYLYLINTKFGEKWLKSVQWSVLLNEARWDKTTWHKDMSGYCDVHRLGELHLNPSQSLQWFFLFPAYEQRLSGNSSKNDRIDPIFTKFLARFFISFFFTKKYKKNEKATNLESILPFWANYKPYIFILSIQSFEKNG